MSSPGAARWPLVAAALALSISAMAACGAAGASGARTDDDRYRDIQRHEAVIARSRALVVEGEPQCAARCDAVHAAARASVAICALADEVADEDSQTRCRAGRATSAELGAAPAGDCVCDAEPRRGADRP